ncbi:MAG: T9SS type A sorting domain-containing protein [Flavobacteriales bacterium]
MNSCGTDVDTNTVTVMANAVISATINEPSCFGFVNGSVNATISGGNGPYGYSWSTLDSTSSITNLTSGSYTVTVEGEGGCVAVDTFTVGEPAVMSLVLDSLDDVVCNGFSDGKALVSTAGGTTPYQFTWTSGETNEDAVSLGAGVNNLLVQDAHGCIDSLSVSISEVNPVQISESISDVTCYGYSDGSASVTASGGGGVYIYDWTTGDSSNAITSLVAGSYSIVVTDQNGCFTQDTLIVDQPDNLLFQLSGINVSCNGLSDGSASVDTVFGGTHPYSFLWSQGSTTGTISGLIAANYTLTVADSNGCSRIDSIQVAEPATLVAGIMESHSISCFGVSDGVLAASVLGGTATYSLFWNTSAATDSISSLASGVYSLTVTDANGCVDSASITLTHPTQVMLNIDSVKNLSCYESGDGVLGVSSTGGVGTHSYSWNTGSNLSLVDQLDSGQYSVSVSDVNGCSRDTSVVISQPLEIQIGFSTSNPICFGDSNGQVTAMVSNAQGSASYAWSNGGTANIGTGLWAGVHAVTVTDSVGCVASDSTQLVDPAALSLVMQSTDVLCNGDSTGTASVAVTNNQGSITYAWSNGSNTASATGLPAAMELVIVSDSAGCHAEDSVLIGEPTPLVISQLWADSNDCFSDSTGSATAIALGGIVPYAYSWSSGGNQSLEVSLLAGSYTVTITDSNGCVTDSSVTVFEPTALSVSIDSTADLICFEDSTGYAAVTGFGGTGTATYIWSDGGIGAIRNNLTSGTHAVTVTDINGCNLDTSLTLTEPTQVVAFIDSIHHVDCFGNETGAGFISSLGGTGAHSFSWSNSTTLEDADSLSAGIYQVTVVDEHACSVELQMEITEPMEIVVLDSIHHAHCDNTQDGSISTIVNGGVAPHKYLWSTSDTSSNILNVPAEAYTLYLTDDHGCADTLEYIVPFDHASPIVNLGSDTGYCIGDEIVLQSGFPSLNVLWSTTETTSDIVVSQAGVYGVVVTDTTGCKGVDDIQITEYQLPQFSLGEDVLICHHDLDSGLQLVGPNALGHTYQWSSGGSAFSEVVFQLGLYSLTVTDSNQCLWSDTVEVLNDTCLGIADAPNTLQFNVYPNPSRGLFYVSIERTSEPVIFSVYDSRGRLVQSRGLVSGTATELDLSNQSKGVYLGIVISGSAVHQLKLVVE